MQDEHNKVEVLDLNTWRWERRADYPFETDISKARTVYYNQLFYVFGGRVAWSHYVPRIAAYNPASDQWSDKGRLLTARYYTGVIWDQAGFVVVGGYRDGYGPVKSEKCQFNGDKLECSHYGPSIDECK